MKFTNGEDVIDDSKLPEKLEMEVIEHFVNGARPPERTTIELTRENKEYEPAMCNYMAKQGYNWLYD